jgi:hypothetical protein
MRDLDGTPLSDMASLREGYDRVRRLREIQREWTSGPELNALAAAYAEVGQFDQAVSYQRKAIEDPLCLPDEQDYVRRLQLYRQGKPFRDGG